MIIYSWKPVFYAQCNELRLSAVLRKYHMSVQILFYVGSDLIF